MAKRKKVYPDVCHDKQQEVLNFMIDLYGDDADVILNALHEMSARVALSSGVEPEAYAAGMKHHWDSLVEQINITAGAH